MSPISRNRYIQALRFGVHQLHTSDLAYTAGNSWHDGTSSSAIEEFIMGLAGQT